MKLSLRSLLVCSLVAAILVLYPLARSSARATDSQEIDLNSEKVQIVHSSAADSDAANININFTNFGEGDCDGGQDDAIASGIEVALSPGSCEILCDGDAPCITSDLFPFDYFIAPFVAHTVNHQEYGTFFGLNPVDVGPGTVSARIVELPLKPIDGCGTWTLNVEATGLDLSSITSNPISLRLNDADGSGPFCFDINDAIIGSQITKPSVPVVRRRTRR